MNNVSVYLSAAVLGLIIFVPFTAVSASDGFGPSWDHWHHHPRFPPPTTTTTTVTSTVTSVVTSTVSSSTTVTTTISQSTTTSQSSSESAGSAPKSAPPPSQIIVNINVTMPFSGSMYVFPVTNVYGATSTSFYESLIAQSGGIGNTYSGYYYGSFLPVSGCQAGINDIVTVTILGQTYTQSATCPAPGQTAYINFVLD